MIGTVLFLLLLGLFLGEQLSERRRRQPGAAAFEPARIFDGNGSARTPTS